VESVFRMYSAYTSFKKVRYIDMRYLEDIPLEDLQKALLGCNSMKDFQFAMHVRVEMAMRIKEEQDKIRLN